MHISELLTPGSQKAIINDVENGIVGAPDLKAREGILKFSSVVIFCAAFLAAIFFATSEAVWAQNSLAEGFGRMKLKSASGAKRLSRVKLKDGTVAERFVLKAGDCSTKSNDCIHERERIEFYDSKPRIKLGSEVWYAYSFYLPPDFAAPPSGGGGTPLILGQVHQQGTSGPEVLFMLSQKGFFIKLTDPYHLDDDPMNPVPLFRRERLAGLNSVLGRWTRVELHAKWSRQSDGFIEVFLNGRPVWTYRGATTNANDRLYFRYGLVRSFVSRCGGSCPTIWALYKDVRQGPTREDVRQ